MFFKNLKSHRELLTELVIKEVVVRYKQSLLGPAWAVLGPLAFMLIFIAVRLFLDIPSEGVPYPIFVFAALLPWMFFNNSVILSTGSMVTNSAVLKKVAVPKELFPLSAILASFVDFLVSAALYLILMIYYGIFPGAAIVLVPVLILVQLVLSVGMGLLFSVLSGYWRDVVKAAPLLMMFWMYLTPVFYPKSSVPREYLTLYMLNPMAGVVDGYRDILLKNLAPDPFYLALSATASLIVFILGLFVFRRLEHEMVDVI